MTTLDWMRRHRGWLKWSLAVHIHRVDGKRRRPQPLGRARDDELADFLGVERLVRRSHERELHIGSGQARLEGTLRLAETGREVGAGSC